MPKKSDCFYVTLQIMHNYKTGNSDLLNPLKEQFGVLNDEPPILVHGFCDTPKGRFPHAWIEFGGKVVESSNNNNYFDVKEKFYEEFNAKSVCFFDHDDVASLLIENGSIVFWELHTRETLDLLKQKYEPATYEGWNRDFLSEYENLEVP